MYVFYVALQINRIDNNDSKSNSNQCAKIIGKFLFGYYVYVGIIHNDLCKSKMQIKFIGKKKTEINNVLKL